jgi:hypothetical protein
MNRCCVSIFDNETSGIIRQPPAEHGPVEGADAPINIPRPGVVGYMFILPPLFSIPSRTRLVAESSRPLLPSTFAPTAMLAVPGVHNITPFPVTSALTLIPVSALSRTLLPGEVPEFIAPETVSVWPAVVFSVILPPVAVIPLTTRLLLSVKVKEPGTVPVTANLGITLLLDKRLT